MVMTVASTVIIGGIQHYLLHDPLIAPFGRHGRWRGLFLPYDGRLEFGHGVAALAIN
jgi:hypothetical protein